MTDLLAGKLFLLGLLYCVCEGFPRELETQSRKISDLVDLLLEVLAELAWRLETLVVMRHHGASVSKSHSCHDRFEEILGQVP
jgi:hypothetical protein